MNQPVRAELITDARQLNGLWSAWDRLWRADPRQSIFNAPGWVRAHWQAYGSAKTLWMPVIHGRDRIVGIVPLAREGRVLRFLASPRSDYHDLLAEPDLETQVLQAALDLLWRNQSMWRSCVLENVPEDSRLIQAVRQLRRPVQRWLDCSVEATSYRLALSPDQPEQVARVLRKKSLRSYDNKLQRLGRLQLRHVEQRVEALAHLPKFFRMHQTRSALAGRPSLFSDRATQVFFGSLLNELDLTRELRFAVLELDGRPIAYHFGFETGGTFVCYKPTFDVDLAQYSPGQILLKRLLEYSISRGLRYFDFTIGDEPYKRRFINQVRNNYTVRIQHRGLQGRAAQVSGRMWRHMRRQVRQVRPVEASVSAARRGRQLFSDVVARKGMAGLARDILFRRLPRAVLARDEVLVFAADGAGSDDADRLRIEQGKLSELAELSLEHGHFFTPERLARARRRLREGHQLLVARLDGQIVHVAWVRVCNRIEAQPEVGTGCWIGLAHPAPIIYDCWTAPAMRGQGIYPRLLRQLVAQLSLPDRPCWIYCTSNNVSSRRGIEKAGFELKWRLRRLRFFGCIAFSRVAAVGSNEAVAEAAPSKAAGTGCNQRRTGVSALPGLSRNS